MAEVIPIPDETCKVRMVHPDRVETTRQELLTSDEATELADRFRLLADTGPLRIIYALLEAGELCVCDLAATVEASESATSHQLRQLRLAGLVRPERQPTILDQEDVRDDADECRGRRSAHGCAPLRRSRHTARPSV